MECMADFCSFAFKDAEHMPLQATGPLWFVLSQKLDLSRMRDLFI
jgi:hypothetical protein